MKTGKVTIEDVPEPYLSAHQASFRSRDTLMASKWVGCFFCVAVYRPKTIKEWVDDGETALCPICRIDSVLPLTQEQFDSDFLEQMRRHWFDVSEPLTIQ